MERYRTILEVNGQRHETYREATSADYAAQLASKAWYSGASVQRVAEGTSDRTGLYVGYTARHHQARIPASIRVYLS